MNRGRSTPYFLLGRVLTQRPVTASYSERISPSDAAARKRPSCEKSMDVMAFGESWNTRPRRNFETSSSVRAIGFAPVIIVAALFPFAAAHIQNRQRQRR